MEIEEQADAQSAHAEIGQHLRIARRHQISDSLDLNDHPTFDEDVGAEAFVELDAFVNDWNSDLPLQLMTQAALLH